MARGARHPEERDERRSAVGSHKPKTGHSTSSLNRLAPAQVGHSNGALDGTRLGSKDYTVAGALNTVMDRHAALANSFRVHKISGTACYSVVS